MIFSGERGGAQVDGDGDEEELLAPQPVGQLSAEKERATAGPHRRGCRRCQRIRPQDRRNEASGFPSTPRPPSHSERDFEPVENPGYASNAAITRTCGNRPTGRRSSHAGMRVETTDADVDFDVDIAMTRPMRRNSL